MAGGKGDDAAKAAELAKKMAQDPLTPPRAQFIDSGSSGGGGSDLHVVERVVRQSSVVAAAPPLMLTRTNYSDWALVMRVQLQGQGRWEVVEHGVGDFHDDREAMGAILRTVSGNNHELACRSPDMVPIAALRQILEPHQACLLPISSGLEDFT